MVEKANKWEPYDPGWLVELALEQQMNETGLPWAFEMSTRALIRGQRMAYIYFVEPAEMKTVWSLTLMSKSDALCQANPRRK